VAKRTKKEKNKVTFAVDDVQGPVIRGWLEELGNQEVGVRTEIANGIEPRVVAGIVLIFAEHVLREAAVEEELGDQVAMVIQQLLSLQKVHRMAERQKRRDKRDHGVVDDFPDPLDQEPPF